MIKELNMFLHHACYSVHMYQKNLPSVIKQKLTKERITVNFYNF